jgi:hypothetical protein
MTNNDLIDESIAILQIMNAEDNAGAIDELRSENARLRAELEALRANSIL